MNFLYLLLIATLLTSSCSSKYYFRSVSSIAPEESCTKVFSDLLTKKISNEVQEVIDQFEFPKEADAVTTNPNLRRAIYDAFNGIDIYTGLPVDIEDMHIDHIIPSSKGGPDNIFNYVLTSSGPNLKKSDKFDPQAIIPMLFFVRTSYAPKVLQKFKNLKKTRKAPVSRAQTKPSIVENLPRIDFSGLTQDQIKILVLIRDYSELKVIPSGDSLPDEVFYTVDIERAIKDGFSSLSITPESVLELGEIVFHDNEGMSSLFMSSVKIRGSRDGTLNDISSIEFNTQTSIYEWLRSKTNSDLEDIFSSPDGTSLINSDFGLWSD
jgi:hypothetical protein